MLAGQARQPQPVRARERAQPGRAQHAGQPHVRAHLRPIHLWPPGVRHLLTVYLLALGTSCYREQHAGDSNCSAPGADVLLQTYAVHTFAFRTVHSATASSTSCGGLKNTITQWAPAAAAGSFFWGCHRAGGCARVPAHVPGGRGARHPLGPARPQAARRRPGASFAACIASSVHVAACPLPRRARCACVWCLLPLSLLSWLRRHSSDLTPVS